MGKWGPVASPAAPVLLPARLTPSWDLLTPSRLSAGHWAGGGTCPCQEPCHAGCGVLWGYVCIRKGTDRGSWPLSASWLPSLMQEPRPCCSLTMLMIKSALSTDMPCAGIVPFSALLLNCYTHDYFLPCSLLRKTFGIASSKVLHESIISSNLVPYSTKSTAL